MDECFPKEIIFVTQQSRIQDFGSAGGLLIEEGGDILTYGGEEANCRGKQNFMGEETICERSEQIFCLFWHPTYLRRLRTFWVEKIVGVRGVTKPDL